MNVRIRSGVPVQNRQVGREGRIEHSPDKRQFDLILPHTVLDTTVPVLINISSPET
jgi:hypothetical protein